MTIYFVEVEQGEREFFEEALKGHVLRFGSGLDDVLADADLLSVFIHSRIKRRFLDEHANIKLITTRSTGYDHIDLAECERRGITVCYVSSYGDNTVAEHTFALILALARRTREAREALDSGAVGGAGLDVIEEERVMQRKWSSVAAQEIIEHLHANAAHEEPRIKNRARVQAYQALMRNATLIARPNVVFTPHIAFNSIQAVERIKRATVENINAFLAGKPVNVLKEPVESRPAGMSSTSAEDRSGGWTGLTLK